MIDMDYLMDTHNHSYIVSRGIPSITQILETWGLNEASTGPTLSSDSPRTLKIHPRVDSPTRIYCSLLLSFISFLTVIRHFLVSCVDYLDSVLCFASEYVVDFSWLHNSFE